MSGYKIYCQYYFATPFKWKDNRNNSALLRPYCLARTHCGKGASLFRRLIFTGVCFLCIIGLVPCTAQKIRFHTRNDRGISLTPLTSISLDFDYLLLNCVEVRSIRLRGENENSAVVIAVDAPEGSDLTVRVESPGFLMLMDSEVAEGGEAVTIPFALRFAYANNGYTPAHHAVSQARMVAVEVPAGIHLVTFPVSTSSKGIRSGSHISVYEDATVPMARSYLFFFGTVGPVRQNPNGIAGVYVAEINVFIDSKE